MFKQEPPKGTAGKPGPKSRWFAGSWPGRHGPLALIVLAIVAVAAAWGGWRHFSHGRIRNEGIRHIVLISIDTCRADRLSCYGYKRASTPHIDAVAKDGVLFRNALTPVPMTTPAHSSMFTGTYPPTHGVRMNNGDRLADSNVTLAEVLRKAGYQTAAFVGGFPLDSQFGLNQGFDTYDCQFSKKKSEKSKWDAERTAEEVNRPALAWLEKNAEKPFFLFLHYFDAHYPYEPPPPYSSDFAADLYAGEIAYVDHCIGQVMDRLRALGAYENTLVIIVGDHGESLGEHGERMHMFFVYQSTLHVPLVIRAPGASPGRVVEGNVCLVDIVPTLLDLVALKVPPQVQGVSLRGALEGGAAPDRKQPIYCEALEAATFECSPLNGVVEGAWKYIRAPRPELYDLKGDPAEERNVVDKEPGVARRLRGRLETMLQEMESAAAGRDPSRVDPEALKKLQGLGYMSGGQMPATSAFDPKLEDPKDFLPTYERLHKANGHLRLNQEEEAKKEFLAIVASHPRVVKAHEGIAYLAAKERRWTDAAEHYTVMVSLLTAQRKDSSKAGPAGPDLTNELAKAHFNLAGMWKELGQVSEAIGQYEQVLRIKPECAEAHFNLGMALAETGQLPEAIGHYEQALRIKPDYPDVHYGLAKAMEQTLKFPEAIGHYREALRIKPDFVPAINNLAWIRATQNDPNLRDGAEAVRLAQYACQLTGGKEAGLLDTLAAAYAQAGRFPDAVTTAQKALALAKSANQAHAANEINSRLAMYKAGQAFRHQPSGPTTRP